MTHYNADSSREVILPLLHISLLNRILLNRIERVGHLPEMNQK